jgi:hypothetical protein
MSFSWMPINHHALIARMGDVPGARAEFARFVAAVIELGDHGRIIREAPGDWGIDAFSHPQRENAPEAVGRAADATRPTTRLALPPTESGSARQPDLSLARRLGCRR